MKTSSAGCSADISAIVKIESADSIPNLHSIISASDGVSVIHVLDEPTLQELETNKSLILLYKNYS